MLISTRELISTRDFPVFDGSGYATNFGDTFRNTEIVRNALIESFWIHARNLFEFFGKQTKTESVEKFCKSSYQRLDFHKELGFGSVGRLYGEICNQISHLKRDRTADESEKLNPLDEKINKLIDDEIERFYIHLKDEFRESITVEPRRFGDSLAKATTATTLPSTTSTTVLLPSVRVVKS